MKVSVRGWVSLWMVATMFYACAQAQGQAKPDDLFYPQEVDVQGSGIAIQTPAQHRSAKLEDLEPMPHEVWYELYQDFFTQVWRLGPAEISISKTLDECLNEDVATIDTSRQGFLLMRGVGQDVKILQSVDVPDEKRTLNRGESFAFNFNGVSYILHAEGFLDVNSREDDWPRTINYRLYLTQADSKVNQLLVAQPVFHDSLTNIRYIGDLDGDAKPDFVIDISPDYEIEILVLFLSSGSKEGDLVRPVARLYRDFDC